MIVKQKVVFYTRETFFNWQNILFFDDECIFTTTSLIYL